MTNSPQNCSAASEDGPCVICGDTNYSLSCGGPTICPKCDCGNFDAATVMKQAKVIADLRADMEKLTDPVAVHINMLRGGIAKPTWANIKHLYPEQFPDVAQPVAWRRVRSDGIVTYWETAVPDGQPLYAAQPPAAPVEESEPLVCSKCEEVMAAAVGLPISEPRSSAVSVPHKITLEGWNIVDDHDRRTIAKFEIWNGSKEELQSIIDRANGCAAQPQGVPTRGEVTKIIERHNRWPAKGDRMTFLGKNGYPFELEAALKTFEVGKEYTVIDCDVQSWSHSVKFEGIEGRHNGVMFELSSPMTRPHGN